MPRKNGYSKKKDKVGKIEDDYEEYIKKLYEVK
jgi:hypothetical protein